MEVQACGFPTDGMSKNEVDGLGGGKIGVGIADYANMEWSIPRAMELGLDTQWRASVVNGKPTVRVECDRRP
jgi:hypothetical protein